MQTAGGNQRQTFNEINITPLTDIFLVLLIIMMVVAPMVQHNREDIKPPQIQNGKPVDQNRLTVEVTSNGAFYVQGKATPEANLTESLKTEFAALMAQKGNEAAQAKAATAEGQNAATDEAEEKNLIIRADKTTKSGTIMKVFEAARDAEFNKVTVAGEALSEGRQSELKGGNAAPPSAAAEGATNP